MRADETPLQEATKGLRAQCAALPSKERELLIEAALELDSAGKHSAFESVCYAYGAWSRNSNDLGYKSPNFLWVRYAEHKAPEAYRLSDEQGCLIDAALCYIYHRFKSLRPALKLFQRKYSHASIGQNATPPAKRPKRGAELRSFLESKALREKQCDDCRERLRVVLLTELGCIPRPRHLLHIK